MNTFLQRIYDIDSKWGERATDSSVEEVTSWYSGIDTTIPSEMADLNDPDATHGFLFATLMSTVFTDELCDEYVDKYYAWQAKLRDYGPSPQLTESETSTDEHQTTETQNARLSTER